jgi:hypothetical protein
MIQADKPERRPELQAPSTAIDTLDYPHPQKHTRGVSIPTVLWLLLLAFGILILLTRGPAQAPPFEKLTSYVCDSVPNIRSSWKRTVLPLVYTCHAGPAVVLARYGVSDGSNPIATKTCLRNGGLVRIWRYANPSPYGPYIFHTTCDDRVLVYYKYRAANYESSQRFSLVVAYVIILASLAGLSLRLFHNHRRHSSARA